MLRRSTRKRKPSIKKLESVRTPTKPDIRHSKNKRRRPAKSTNNNNNKKEKKSITKGKGKAPVAKKGRTTKKKVESEEEEEKKEESEDSDDGWEDVEESDEEEEEEEEEEEDVGSFTSLNDIKKSNVSQIKQFLKLQTAARLKEMLAHNKQKKSGAKGELVVRIADAYIHGCLPRCPKCYGGLIKVSGEDMPHYSCPGYFDDDHYVHCNYKSCTITRTPWSDVP